MSLKKKKPSHLPLQELWLSATFTTAINFSQGIEIDKMHLQISLSQRKLTS